MLPIAEHEIGKYIVAKGEAPGSGKFLVHMEIFEDSQDFISGLRGHHK